MKRYLIPPPSSWTGASPPDAVKCHAQHTTFCLNIRKYYIEKIVWMSKKHQVALATRISLTISHHPSLSSIAPGRSSKLHPLSAQSWVLAGRPTLAHPWVDVHRRTSPMSSSLLLHQYPACLVRLGW